MYRPTLVPYGHNGAKYEVVLTGLDLAKAAGVSSIIIHSDSQVVIRHIKGDYEVKGKQMKKYFILIKRRTYQNFAAEFVQVTWKEYEHAD